MELRVGVLLLLAACAQSQAPLPTAEALAAEAPLRTPVTFAGTLPCADCPGLEVRLTLLHPGAYVLEETYLERGSFVSRGRWEQTAGTLRLVPRGGGERLFQRLGSDRLEPLDTQGQPIEAPVDLGLRRTEGPQIYFGRLQAVEDRVRLVECGSSRVLGVDDATVDRQIRETIRPFESEAFGELLGFADGEKLVAIEAERLAADAQGCAAVPAENVIAHGRGETFSFTIDAEHVRVAPNEGPPLESPAGSFAWTDGAWRSSGAVEVELWPQPCAAPGTTTVRAWSIRLVSNGETFEGCASLGPAWAVLGGG